MKFIEPVGRELKLLGKVTVYLFVLVTLLMIFEYNDVFGVETAMFIHEPSCSMHVQLGLDFAERIMHLAIPTINSLDCQNYPAYFYLTFLAI